MLSKVCRNSTVFGECSADDPNLKWGSDISDALLVNDTVVQERGRVEIDSSYTNRKSVGAELHALNYMQPGAMVAIVEGNVSNVGILRNIKLDIKRSGNSISVGSSIEVERNV